MDTTLILVALIIAVALAFDYINGFHDAANSVATIVATRVLSPFHAVAWAAFWNFIAAFAFETGVASTVGKGMVDLKFVTPYVILAGLLGAITWDLITWYFGLPTSSSHALLGGYGGAAMAKVAMTVGITSSFDALVISGWTKTIAFIESIDPDALDGAEGREVVLKFPGGMGYRFTGVDYLRRFALPNFYFHAASWSRPAISTPSWSRCRSSLRPTLRLP
ncbi:MAG: hypothetical protein B7X34_00035 [Acidobacteriia bacterium 12-62-4]|nr:MAG: hypothetical protein B7X34_00035 [Acidobacteriia bacterium 12-62-4]